MPHSKSTKLLHHSSFSGTIGTDVAFAGNYLVAAMLRDDSVVNSPLDTAVHKP